MIAAESPEVLQQEIDEAKSRLSAKIDTLEQQYHVVENVQQAGTVVAATVEAVQATTQAVNGAVESLHSAIDVESHVRKHPWFCLAGSAALGYLATRWWNRSQEIAPPPRIEPLLDSAADPSLFDSASRQLAAPPMAVGQIAPETPAAVANLAYHQAMLQSSPTYNLKILAMNTVMGVVREAAARAVPRIADFLISHVDTPSGEHQSANPANAR